MKARNSLINFHSTIWALICLLLTNCTTLENNKVLSYGEIILSITSEKQTLKSLNPDEEKISNINILVFNHNNILENNIYLNVSELESTADGYIKDLNLILNKNYSFFVIANLGYKLEVNTMEELKDYRYYLSYPDEFSEGIPMSAYIEDVLIKEGVEVEISLERLMGKISLCFDRSGLDPDVDLFVTSIQLMVSPKSVLIFGENRVKNKFEAFTAGYYKEGLQVEDINYSSNDKKSGYISLYALENIQGDLLSGNIDYSLKKFPLDDYREKLCSHIEICIDYTKEGGKAGKLYYRYYLGESASDFSIKRNTHYKICIKPLGDGLNKNDWLVEVADEL